MRARNQNIDRMRAVNTHLRGSCPHATRGSVHTHTIMQRPRLEKWAAAREKTLCALQHIDTLWPVVPAHSSRGPPELSRCTNGSVLVKLWLGTVVNVKVELLATASRADARRIVRRAVRKKRETMRTRDPHTMRLMRETENALAPEAPDWQRTGFTAGETWVMQRVEAEWAAARGLAVELDNVLHAYATLGLTIFEFDSHAGSTVLVHGVAVRRGLETMAFRAKDLLQQVGSRLNWNVLFRASLIATASARVDELMQPYRPGNARVYAFCVANVCHQYALLPAEIVHMIVTEYVCVRSGGQPNKS